MNEQSEVTQLLKSARKIVSVFSYSHESRKKLGQIKKQLHIDAKQLVQDVSTRWGEQAQIAK